jgi:hypothetical protein
MAPTRRFPPPRHVEEITESFKVTAANGQALAYVYHEDEPGRRMTMKRLTRRGAAACGEHRQAAGAAKGPRDTDAG